MNWRPGRGRSPATPPSTPLANVPLRPGPHTFRAHLPDGRVLERTVEIDASHRHVAFE